MPSPILRILNSQKLRNQRFLQNFDENIIDAKTLFIPMLYLKIFIYLNFSFSLGFCLGGCFVLFFSRDRVFPSRLISTSLVS